MTLDADAYTPVNEGLYTGERRASQGSGKLPKHYQIFENGIDNITTLDWVMFTLSPEFFFQI